MKIKFKGHQSIEREVEFTEGDKHRLFELMKEEFINHIVYSRFNDLYSPTRIERQIVDMCNDFGVDVEYSKDRIAFFTAILKEMKYQ